MPSKICSLLKVTHGAIHQFTFLLVDTSTNYLFSFGKSDVHFTMQKYNTFFEKKQLFDESAQFFDERPKIVDERNFCLSNRACAKGEVDFRVFGINLFSFSALIAENVAVRVFETRRAASLP